MRITLDVVGIGQTMDLDTQEVVHTIQLQLPSGRVMTVTAEEGDISALIHASVGVEEEEEAPEGFEPMEEGLYAPGPNEPVEEVKIFGGTAATQIPEGTNLVEPPLSHRLHDEPEPEKMVFYDDKGRRKVKSKTVPKDEAGNPVVRGGGDNAPPAPPETVDDDNVPSL